MSKPFRRSFGRVLPFLSEPVDMATLNNIKRRTMFYAYSHVVSSISHIMNLFNIVEWQRASENRTATMEVKKKALS